MKISIFAIAASIALGFMSETVEVVFATVKGSSDPVRVNKADFDADQEKPENERQYGAHSGKDEPEQSVAAGNAAQTAATVAPADSRLVMKDGSKFFIVDGMGAKLTSELLGAEIDEEGYKSEKAAQDAIADLLR